MTILEPDKGSYTLSHTYDRVLATSHLYCGKNQKNKFLLMKVSDRDQNVKIKMLVVCEVI